MPLQRSLLVSLLFLLLPPLAGAPPAPATGRPWRAGLEPYSNPHSFLDPQGRPTGFSVELLRAVARDQGLEVEFVALDWPDLLAEFQAGRLDLVCHVAETAERRAYLLFSTTTIVMRGRLFQRADTAPVRSPGDLAGRRLAVQRDSRAFEYLSDRALGLEFVLAPSLPDCVRALHEGRADLLLSTDLITSQLINRTGYPDIHASEYQFPDFDYHVRFGVARDQPELLAQINEGLANVHRNGTYDRLYEKWLGPPAVRPLRWSDVQLYVLPLLTVVLVALGAVLWQRRLLRRLSNQARAIRENEERLRLVFEGSQDGFWDWDVAGGRVLRSPRWSEMLGYGPSEVKPGRQAFLDLIHPEDVPGLIASEQPIRQGRDQFMQEFRMRAKSGEWKWILDRGKVVARDPATNAPLRISGTHTDITARKLADEAAQKLQLKMVETQKLESLGILAGGIAHDFNNLLTVILGNSSIARLDTADSPAQAARLDSVITSANRAAELCRQLLAYAGKGSYLIERINLNDLITETTRLLELSINKQARLEFELSPHLPRIEADASQIRQVVMNLVINAAEAMTGSAGVIQIATMVVRLPLPKESDSVLPAAVAPGDYICVEIVDTGCGMTPEVVARIFDPFFSTKFTGRGLGLAAVLGIVRTHGGTLDVQSAPGRGSTFRIYLPVKQSAPPFEMGR